MMNDQIYQRIEDSARFRELVEKRQRFATILSVIMLAVYISAEFTIQVQQKKKYSSTRI
ncbi:hypothetical protein KFY44_11665 [Salmonella enterica subsp. enterica serovar Typhimurium]|nr:hypothetical protein [Salmonella enterica subsp. enterica serovar Typhimurium]